MAVAKRVLIYILVAALSVGAIIPSVSAAGYDLGDSELVSLFSPTDEYYVQNGAMPDVELQNAHRVWVNGYGSIKWTLPRDTFGFRVFLTVQVPNSGYFEQSMVRVKINGQEKRLYFIGLYGNEFQFSIEHYDNIYDIEVLCGDPNATVPFTGNFNVTDIYTTRLNVNPFYYLQSAKLSGLCASKVDGSLYSSVFAQSDPDAADPQLPYSLEKKMNGNEDWGIISGDFEFDVFANYFGSAYNDMVILHVKTCGSITSVGACMVVEGDDTDGNAFLFADDEINCYLANGQNDYFGSNNMRWPYYYYIIVIDTSGQDMSSWNLRVNISIDPVSISNVNQSQSGVYCEILRGYAAPSRVGEPWYADIVGWIKRGFESVVNKLDEVFNGDSTVADDLEDLENQLDELTPTIDNQEVIDSVDANIQEFLPDEDLDHVGGYFRDLFYLLPNIYMILPFTFALVGYLLFGKRS